LASPEATGHQLGRDHLTETERRSVRLAGARLTSEVLVQARTGRQAAIGKLTNPPLDLKPGRTRRDRSTSPRPPRPPTRREKLTAIITSHPPRDWSGHELAVLLGVKPRNMLTQLGEWARLGFFTGTGFGTYKLNTPPAETPSTNPPDL
jgi:hypothetical protein